MPQSRGLYVRVGALILLGLALLVAFLLFLASGNFGVRAEVFETYVEESVQGLDVGTPVRFRGVAIGRVTQIGLVAAEYERPRGTPFAQAFQLVLIRFAIDLDRVGEVPSLDDAIRLGLRARIASQGITGVNYLELDFLPPDRYPPRPVPWEPRYPYLPAAPSTVAQVTNAAEALVARLQQIDFEGFVANLTGLVSELRGELSNGDLSRALAEAAATLAALREVVQGAELAATVGEVRAAAQAVRGAGDAAEALVAGPEVRGMVVSAGQAAGELRTAMARLPQAVAALEATVRAARAATTDAQADLVPILRDLRAAASNLRDTTELLRRSPSQALFGAPPPPDRR
jgi:paraquat-inducible protein B